MLATLYAFFREGVAMGRFDTVVLGGQAVARQGLVRADVGIKDGRISVLGEGLVSGDADEVVDAAGKLVLPGAVDAHFHLGIYRDITEDARSETLSSLAGGVTSIISYFRTGSHYLGKSGPYAGDLPRGTGGDERALARGLRLSSGADGTGSSRRDPPPRRRRGRHLLQVLHVLQGSTYRAPRATPAATR